MPAPKKSARPAHAGPLQAGDRLARARQAWEQGRVHAQARRLDEAARHFERAVALAPDDGLYRLNLSNVERQRGHIDAAIEQGRHALRLDPGSRLACHQLAELLRAQQRLREVIETLDQLSPTDLRDARWYLLRGLAHLGLQELEPAVSAFLEAMARATGDPNLRDLAAQQLGHCLMTLNRHDEAAICYRMLVDSDPAHLGSALYAAYCAAWSCDWHALAEDRVRLETAIGRVRQRGPQASVLLSPFCLIPLADDPALSRWLATASVAREHPQARAEAPRRIERVDGRIRLGLMSADFRHHATTILLSEMLEHLDRDRWDLCFYATRPGDDSPLERRIRACATIWRDVHDWSSERVARQMRDDHLGIAFDLKGFTSGARLDILARRPAPLQVAWLGYPGTSGASYLDYIIGDRVVTPLDRQADYSECIAQMPHCYQPNDSQRSRPAAADRVACGLPPTGFVFASFNQSYKISPEVFAAWCEILRSTPDSLLWLLVPQPAARAHLQQAARAAGVDPARLVFADFLPTERHRARLPLVDLFLDSWPCSGHTTASDALWAGVPLLTLAGASFAARVAASLLHTVALPELVCSDWPDYIARAVRYAHDPQALAGLRRRLEQQRLDSPLFDGRRFARDFGALLQRMVDRHDAGLPPAPLAAETAVAAPELELTA